jgi:hypothetical protein
MARGKQLSELIAHLRAETGRTQSVSTGISEIDNLKVVLKRIQETLYEQYEWPHLRVERSIQLNAGQRYYDMPEDINFDRIHTIKYKYSNVYINLERGISFDEYSIFDSNENETSSPAQKWDIRFIDIREQVEIWPIPNATNTVHFIGTKTLTPLIQESDRADLDDNLIVLYAAAEILARQESPDAQSKLEQANNHLLVLRRNSQSSSKTIQMGLGNKLGDQSNRLKTRVIVS